MDVSINFWMAHELVLIKTNATSMIMYVFMIWQGKGRVMTELKAFDFTKSFAPIGLLL
jgi:hypothetical protein